MKYRGGEHASCDVFDELRAFMCGMGNGHLERRRVATAVVWKGMTLSKLAVRMECSFGHLVRCLDEERPLSESLRARMRAVLGDPAWRFVIGETDALTDAPVDAA